MEESRPFESVYTLGTANSACSVVFYARISGIRANPLKYTDPDGKITITNQTADHIILRGEDGQTGAVKPNEIFDTSKHGFNTIDGILLPDGSTYKINNGNSNSKLLVTENDGSFNVKIADMKGKLINALGDFGKSLINGEIYASNSKLLAVDCDESELISPLDYSGMYEKGNPGLLSWWNKAMKDIHGPSNVSRNEWNTRTLNFLQENPNGVE
jgi:hypothetical protein